jgi:hypothetical protein
MKLDWIDINWVNYPNYPKAILQIPISIEGVEKLQFIQLDTGCPESLLFGYQAHQILPKHSDIDKDKIHLSGSVENILFSDFKFDILQNQGKDRAEAGQQKIGLLGTDFLRNKVLVLDFINDRILISEEEAVINELDYKINYVKMYDNPVNLVFIGFKLNDYDIPIALYDCGSSSSDFIFHRKEDWAKYVGDYDETKLTHFVNVNPLGRYSVFGYKIDGAIQIGDFMYNNPTLEYKDTDLFKDHKWLGTLGNHPFFDACIVVDFINMKFGLSK